MERQYLFRPAQLSDRYGMHQLRYRVYTLERGWTEENEVGLEVDQWDSIASLPFVALDSHGGEVAGTARIVVDSPLGFPYEESATLPSWIDRSTLYEVSRLAVSPDYRDSQSTVLVGLCRRIWHAANRLNKTHWCAVVDRPVAVLLRRLRFDFKHSEDPVFHLGSKSVPLICEMKQSKEVLFSERINRELQRHIEEMQETVLVRC